MSSKNDDPNGCPDTVLGPCEAVCARCGRDMVDEFDRLCRVEDAARAVVASRVLDALRDALDPIA